MKQRLYTFLIAIIITLLFSAVLVFAYFFSVQTTRLLTAERHITVLQKALDRTPTIKEIQRRVGAEPDGIIGPNTIALWKKVINDQYAVESFERMAGKSK